MRSLLAAGLLLLLTELLPLSAPAVAQIDRAQSAFDRLTVEQRVGQLFLVAYYVPPGYYEGPDADPLRDVRTLVVSHGLGGVVLQKGNNVFANERGRDLPTEIAELTRSMQAITLGDGGPGVPLFVAVDHEGDLDPLTHLREGFTAVPSAMAIGATYDEAHAEAVGRIVGGELAAVGVNMLLGPVLDVLAEPRVDSGGDIGTRSFGGDPYWVRRMGSAYVRGVHTGSGDRVATVAKHFPGHGGSDRSTDDEIATVNKPIESLRDIELQPFAAVTSAAPGDPDARGVTEALMTSHIRYRAIHPDVRRVTPPISFDQQGLGALLGMEGFPFAAWRDGGGLVIADSLGVRAVRRWFDPTEATFPNRQIARQALLAGNDVLILAQFAVQPSWSRMLDNVEDTMSYFAAQYRTDRAFRARVDEAALRVLRRKAALYPDWSEHAVAVPLSDLADRVGGTESRETVESISADALTSLRALDRPRGGDRIVIVSDFDRLTKPTELACPTESCGMSDAQWTFHEAHGPTLVESALLARYGPTGAGVVNPSDLTSVTFCQLRELVNPRPPTPTTDTSEPPLPGEGPTGKTESGCDPAASPEAVMEQLALADWIVFAFADLDPTEVRDLRGLLLPQVNAYLQAGDHARLGVLSFGPPYYIDQTNFFQLDAYLAAYSKIPTSIDSAVAALFGDLDARGALPVDYEDAGLTLATLLSPDPDQQLPLTLRSQSAPSEAGEATRIVVELGPVSDRAGHPVPDGTLFVIRAEPASALGQGPPPEARTVSAVARVEVPLFVGGTITLRAVGENVASEPLTVVVPVPSATPTVAAAPPSSGDETGEPAAEAPVGQRAPAASDLVASVVAIAAASLLAYAPQIGRGRDAAARLRAVLLVAACGLVGYDVAATALRSSGGAPPARATEAIVALVLAGCAVGFVAARAADAVASRDRA